MYGCRYIGQRAGFAGSGHPNTGGFVPLAPSDCVAVYFTASERNLFAFAVMFAMDDFSHSCNRWRISGKRHKG